MSLLNIFKKEVVVKQPTTQQDYIAYASGGKKTYSSTYNTYVESVEALDKAVRIIANIASMANINVYKESLNSTKPLKVKNIDFKYNTNDQDSSHDLISMIFASIFTQGAAILLTETNKKTKFINFFVYDVAKFRIETTENRLVDSFVYTSEGGNEVTFKPEDVIYIAPRLSASNLVYAISRLKSLNDMLLLQANIMRQSSDYYAAGGKQSAIISPKEPMSVEKARELKLAFDTFLQTTATRTMFINTEVDVSTVSNAQSPTQIMEALTKINSLIIEQFGIPEYLYGKYNGYVNDAAVATACRLFFQIHMRPVFKSIEYQFTRYFRNTLGLKDAKVEFDFKDIEVLEDSLQTKTDNAGALYKLGIVSMNEAREMCELEPLSDDAANLHMLPAYLVSEKPIAIENYTEAISQLLAQSTTPTSQPSGNAGGADNENLINGSVGGSGNIGE